MILRFLLYECNFSLNCYAYVKTSMSYVLLLASWQSSTDLKGMSSTYITANSRRSTVNNIIIIKNSFACTLQSRIDHR